jgi:hypothetical protein
VQTLYHWLGQESTIVATTQKADGTTNTTTSTIEEQPAGTLESIASSNISYIIMQSSQ